MVMAMVMDMVIVITMVMVMILIMAMVMMMVKGFWQNFNVNAHGVEFPALHKQQQMPITQFWTSL